MGVPYCLRPILENADFPCRKKPGGLDGIFTAKPGTFTGFSGLGCQNGSKPEMDGILFLREPYETGTIICRCECRGGCKEPV